LKPKFSGYAALPSFRNQIQWERNRAMLTIMMMQLTMIDLVDWCFADWIRSDLEAFPPIGRRG
jgi:hypothetical protein